MLTTNVMASRTGGRGVFSGSRGKGTSINGMTLQDYAAGDAWASGFGGASSTTG